MYNNKDVLLCNHSVATKLRNFPFDIIPLSRSLVADSLLSQESPSEQHFSVSGSSLQERIILAARTPISVCLDQIVCLSVITHPHPTPSTASSEEHRLAVSQHVPCPPARIRCVSHLTEGPAFRAEAQTTLAPHGSPIHVDSSPVGTAALPPG